MVDSDIRYPQRCLENISKSVRRIQQLHCSFFTDNGKIKYQNSPFIQRRPVITIICGILKSEKCESNDLGDFGWIVFLYHRRIIEGPLTPFRAKLCYCFRSALTGRYRKKLPAEKAWRDVEVNNFGFICFLLLYTLSEICK